MSQHEDSREAVEKTVRDSTRRTRRPIGAEDTIRIVIQGLRGEERMAEVCRRAGLHQHLYDRWSKDVLEAGQKRLNGDTVREAGSDEVKTLRAEEVQLALAEPERSPRELSVRCTEEQGDDRSESTVDRLLKSRDLITAPAFIVMKAADKFQNQTTAMNQLWQTAFTDITSIGWGWLYLSTVMDDSSRSIIAWRLCKTMSAADVSATLQDPREATGFDRASVRSRPRLLLDNGPCDVSSQRREWLNDSKTYTPTARPLIRTRRARLSAGIARSRTASSSNTTTSQGNLSGRSRTS